MDSNDGRSRVKARVKAMGCLLLALLIPLNLPAIAAGFGSAVTYQGELQDVGSPANGSYDFEARLFADQLGTTQIAGPVLHSTVPVLRGIFTLELDFGKNSFDGANRWIELRVRRTGNGAFEILLPRQRITPAPYALRSDTAIIADGAVQAGTVPWLGVTSVPDDFADGDDADALGHLACANGQVPQIAEGSWGCAAPAQGTVTNVDSGTGLSGGPITLGGILRIAPGGVSTELLADNSVTGAKVIDGSLSLLDLDNTVQARIAGTCSVGQVIAAINANGTVDCRWLPSLPRSSSHPLVPGTPIADYVSLAVNNVGNPVIAYGTTTAVRISRCSNPACTTLPATALVGQGVLALDAGVSPTGLIRIGFSNASGVGLIACNDIACSNPTSVAISTSGFNLHRRGMALDAAGIPAFTYTNGSLMFRRCLDEACSVLDIQRPIAGVPGISPAIAYRSDGRPVIASAGPSSLALVLCDGSDCSSATVREWSANGYFSDIVVPSDDQPIVVSLTASRANLYLHRCNTPDCTEITSRLIYASGTTSLKNPAVWIDGRGLPVAAFSISSGSGWQIASCSDMNCNSATIASVPLQFAADGDAVRGMDGYPFLAGQYDQSGVRELRIVKCYSNGCE